MKRIRAKQLKLLKKKKKMRKKLIKKLPKSLHKIFAVVDIKKKDMIVNIPPKSILPHEIYSKRMHKVFTEQNIQIINAVKKHFPKPPKKSLQYRVIYFYRPGDAYLKLMRKYEDMLLKLEKNLHISHIKRKKTNKYYKTMFYIPYIALVPKDYNPPMRATVTSIPMYNQKLKRISIKHLRKSKKFFTELHVPKMKKVCLKWKLKITFDKHGHAKHGRKCAKWKMISEEKEKTIFEKKDKNLLNSMGSMKWVVRGLTAGIIH